MAEYRIVAKVDPQTGAGAQKVKQDLRGIQTEANATGSAINRTFDQARFEKTIGGLVARLETLDDRFAGLAVSSVKAQRTNEALINSLDALTASSTRAGGAASGQGKAADGASASNTRLESTLRRVLAATDAEAAEQLRLNTLLKDAKALNEAKLLSDEKLLAIQRQVAMAGKEQVAVTGQQRMGLQQLGFQLGDVATMYSLGAKPAQIFGSQIGQISQALMLMGGKDGSVLSKVAGFLGGPWGIALTVGTILLGPFLGKLLGTNDALDEQVDKLKKDAAESELSRQAHERWSHTLDGLIERQWKFVDAMKERLKVQGLADQHDLADAQSRQSQIQKAISDEQQRLQALRQQLSQANAPIALTGGRGDEAALGAQALRVSQLQGQIKTTEDRIRGLMTDFKAAQGAITTGQILVAEQQGKAMVDATARAKLWGDNYQQSVRAVLGANGQLLAQGKEVTAGFSAVQAAMDKAASAGANFRDTGLKAGQLLNQLNQGKIGVGQYRDEMIKLAGALNKAADAAQKAKTATDGVARFKSSQQAIGIAGRELQADGLKVSENVQFGGVSVGAHKGAGHREGRAVDVNQGKGIVEADVPDIRAKFDALAVRYAARGYIVLWNGKRYDPSGTVSAIPGGQDQHRDHMHLEAPSTIVGKATQGSMEAAARREETEAQKAANVAREKGDFVSSIIDQQSLRGLESGPESLQGRMDKIVGDYKRKFNTDTMPEADQKKIRDALIGGDAREVQKSFDDTYVKPLERLQALQGKTGLDRAILNAQLEEEGKLKRELDPIEKATIENGIRRGDALQREAQILEQIKGPLDTYKQTIAALNKLLADGNISQTQYNARLADLNNQDVQRALGNLPGQTSDGTAFADIAAVSDENTRYAQQLADLEDFRQRKVDLGASYDEIELAMARQHQDNLMKIEQARKDVQLQSAEEIASGVTSAMKAMFGEQSKAYKAAFAVEKAVAIARAIVAIQTGIAQASAQPFPMNLAAIASVVAATASIVSNIQAVALNFKDGGRVYGPGGPRSDSVRANLSRDEFVVNANAARRNMPLLEAINSGRDVRQMGQARAVETARVVAQAAPVAAAPPPPQDIQVVNVSDPKAALAALQTAEGKKVLVNMIESDPNTFRQLLGR